MEPEEVTQCKSWLSRGAEIVQSGQETPHRLRSGATMTATQTLTSIERSVLACKGDASPVGRTADRLENSIERAVKSLTATPVATAVSEILIFEDNRLNLKLYRDLLEARGHQIAQSNDVNRILSAMRLSRPDLILVDICAPGRYGLEAASEIRQEPELCDIPMIGIADTVPARCGSRNPGCRLRCLHRQTDFRTRVPARCGDLSQPVTAGAQFSTPISSNTSTIACNAPRMSAA